MQAALKYEPEFPTVSVVMPVYNGEETIKESIESVFAQTYPVHELIIVDDGSTDSSVAIAKSYGNAVRIVRQNNSGHATARNAGIELATGDFIAMLDADDIWYPDKLESQLSCSEDYDVIYTAVKNIGQADHVDEVSFDENSGIKGDHLCPLLLDNFIAHSSVMIRREALLEVGGYNTSFVTSSDWELWLRLAQAGKKFWGITEPKTYYRWSPTSLSKKHDRTCKDRLRVVESALERSDYNSVPIDVRKHALENVWRTSAWFASRDQPLKAASWYLKAIKFHPTSLRLWRELVSTLLGMVVHHRKHHSSA